MTHGRQDEAVDEAGVSTPDPTPDGDRGDATPRSGATDDPTPADESTTAATPAGDATPGDATEAPSGSAGPGPASAAEPAPEDDPDAIWRPRAWDAPTAVLPAAAAGTSAPSGPAEPAPRASGAPVRVPTRPAPAGGASATTGSGPAAPSPTTTQQPVVAPGAGRPAAGPPVVAPPDRPQEDAPVRRRRWPKVVGLAAAVLLVLGGLYVGALWAWRDTVPTGTTVAGVELGGLGATEAVTTLETGLASATSDPIPVAAGESSTTVDPAAAGLALDARATVDGLTGFDLRPQRLWHHLVGRGPAEPVTTVDDAALTAAATEAAASLSVAPVDGTVAFVDGAPSSTDPVPGATVDPDAAADAIRAEWLTGARPLELPTEPMEPTIDAAEVERVLTEVAEPLAEAPVTVAIGGQQAELPVDVLTGAASFVPQDGELALQLDGALLSEAVLERTTDLLSDGTEAAFAFQNGGIVIVPGEPGTSLDPAALAAAVAEAATTDRTAEVELVSTDPAEAVAELQGLGVSEVVSSFDTPLTAEPRRTQNIRAGAAAITGTLVRPGETFSLTEALGPIDAANGYTQAGAIVNGEHVDAWGGGLSQLATTTYNAGFFAGYEDVEHHPHSEWFQRYPQGREATIFTGSLDLRFTNDTPYAGLIEAWVADGRLYVRIWSTPYWEVETTTSGRSNVQAPTTVYSQSETCQPQSAGNPGFTVTVTRTVSREGVVDKDESWTVRYRPQNTVVCGPAPGTTAP